MKLFENMIPEGSDRPRNNTAAEVIAVASEFLPGGRGKAGVEYYSMWEAAWRKFPSGYPCFDFNNDTYRVKP